MKTNVVKINSKKPEKKIIQNAAGIIRKEGLVAFPTETVYGLGANALDAHAVRKIFKAKKRPSDNPLIVHISDPEMLKVIAKKIPSKAFLLMKKFWPGPLTLVFKKTKKIPNIVTGGGSTVAVRMPHHSVAHELIKESGVPIAAPSANTATRPSPTEARHVYEDLNGVIPLILDGGRARIGVESTVLDLTTKTPILLRKGKITKSDIEKIVGPILVHTEKRGKIKSPGQKYRHYAPKAELILVSGGTNAVKKIIKEQIVKKTFVITFSEKKKMFQEAYATFIFGKKNDVEAAARNFFSLLRICDRKKADVIIVEMPSKKGVGEALRDRISRAASQKI